MNKLKKNIYVFFFISIILLIIIDELAFILYNISLYQIFCGSNFIKIYESFFKLPIFQLNNLIFNYEMSEFNSCDSINIYQMFYNVEHFTNNIFFNTLNDTINIKSNFELTNTLNYNDNIYLIHFDTLTTQKNKITFEILQNKIYIFPGENNLAFFRITNNTDQTLKAFSLYVVSPPEFTPFINKLQCFCYEELLIYPKETIDLPVLFKIEPDILRLDTLNKELVIEYIIII